MKKLLIPVLIAVLAGVGGGSGFSYMRVSKAFVADSTKLADSLKAHPPAADSAAHTAPAHAAASDTHTAVDSAGSAGTLPPTPADSIRTVEASRATLRGATKGLPDATTPAHAPAAGDPKHPDIAHESPPKPANATASAANIVRQARNEAMNAVLPEQRLAKIFAAMSAKDAAKVMEQMPDVDVRAILAMMSDRTAAAILSQFPAARAAAITKGAARAPEVKP